MAQMTINQQDYDQLKKLYKQAVLANKSQFTFMGQELLTTYAKYLIEYLKTKF